MSNAVAPEDLPECTQALLNVLVPEEDLTTYAEIEQRIRESEHRRNVELEKAQSRARDLSHTLAQLRSSSTREAEHWKSSARHQDDLEKVQAQNFDLAKRIKEDESRLHNVELELERLAKDIEDLIQGDVESQEEMDKDAIAVAFFRKLGFIPCYLDSDGRHESPAFQSLMVRSESRNRSTEFEVNDDVMKTKAISPYILANQLWLASE